MPSAEETFIQYTERIGLNPEPLLIGLSENSLTVANQRLATELMRRLPQYYERWVLMKRRTREF